MALTESQRNIVRRVAEKMYERKQQETYEDPFSDLVATVMYHSGFTYPNPVSSKMEICRRALTKRVGPSEAVHEGIDTLYENGDVKMTEDKTFYLTPEKAEEIESIIRERKQQR